MNSKIILPGGAGLVGQNLVVHLKRAGYTNLVVLDKHQTNLEILRSLHPDIIVEYADLAEPGEWERHFEGAAALVMLQAQIGAPTLEPFIRNNITSTKYVLAAIKRYNIPYTVHISSSVVESVANDDYTNTKKEQEEMVLASGINCVVLRPTLMFGWFDRKHLGWLSRFMQKVPLFPIPGDGRYMRQPLYVGDFASIIVSCLKSGIHGQVFNISGREKIDYVDIIRAIRKAVAARTMLLHIPYGLFYVLLKIWALFDRNPPFTADQLKALVAHDEFEVIDWPTIFQVTPTPFSQAVDATFNDPQYSRVVLDF
ncbi:NAD-dependent epimerase/dehydratase family protein [Aquitalea palustris]|uniref:NAD-dependent epimerase/dehydratase family protein n=1 Tax=Aquitalea palustris TaxID=2480983 RepID=A0A454JJQ7_9NEIS|nr:NAD-dependent epimerase/dehydratase family protein [Aquitalea palustris]RMC99273.1 NAD-dependent epimerase/dehydratase family protein [Aquitalea palustris]